MSLSRGSSGSSLSTSCGSAGSGSGRVAVVPVDRGGQRGSNGTGFKVAVAVLAELWVFEYLDED
jgi:hypothetical protein